MNDKNDILTILNNFNNNANFSDLQFCKDLLFIIYQNMSVLNNEDDEINQILLNILKQNRQDQNQEKNENCKNQNEENFYRKFYSNKLLNTFRYIEKNKDNIIRNEKKIKK